MENYSKEDIISYAEEWLAENEHDFFTMTCEGTYETIDGCVIEPDGHCSHGYPSPLITLGLI